MPSSLYHGTASLSVCEQKVDFPQRKLQEGSTSVPCSVTLHKWPHSWEHQDIGHLLQQHSLSSSAHLLQSDSSQFIEQPLWCDHQLVWFWDLIVTICSASICSTFYSYLFCYSFRNSFRNKSPCNSLTINTSLPEDISSRRDCHHQTISSIYYLLLSPMFNYSVQHRMSPSSALKLNFNPPPVLRSNFHGQPSLFKWEKEREAQKITSHEGIQLISFYTSSTPTVEDFIHPVKLKVPFSELSRQVFQKSMVNMLQTAHRQRKWSTKFKIIWLRQQQQMKVIFSHEGREFKSLIKMNVKWTARKVTSTVKCVLWALSRRSKYFQCEKGREILSETKEKGRKSKDRPFWMQPAFSWKTVLKKRKFNNSWRNKDWLGLEFIEQNSSCTKQKMKLQVKMRFCATVRSQSTF